MHSFVKAAALSAVLLCATSNAFVLPSARVGLSSRQQLTFAARSSSPFQGSKLYSSPENGAAQDDEIERLKSMAAKLRSEAAQLEAEKANQLAEAAEKAFRKFDTNQDGEISIDELKIGLEKSFKLELSEERVKSLMDSFDTSGDGTLQLDEFVGVDRFRNKLEALAREEKKLAVDAGLKAKRDAEAVVLAEARLNILNDKDPTTKDKLISIIPYLFPLMDGIQFGRFFFEGQENPLVAIIAVVYTLYRSIPFGGFIAFFALSTLSGNLGLNRLIRFNMQQAIYLDIALFFPSLIGGIVGAILKGTGTEIPAQITVLGTDAIFISLLLALTYCTVSSLIGVAPNKIPIMSQAADDRMPTIDMIDEKGFIRPKDPEDDKGNKKD